jgi:hypothetical protein
METDIRDLSSIEIRNLMLDTLAMSHYQYWL